MSQHFSAFLIRNFHYSYLKSTPPLLVCKKPPKWARSSFTMKVINKEQRLSPRFTLKATLLMLKWHSKSTEVSSTEGNYKIAAWDLRKSQWHNTLLNWLWLAGYPEYSQHLQLYISEVTYTHKLILTQECLNKCSQTDTNPSENTLAGF